MSGARFEIILRAVRARTVDVGRFDGPDVDDLANVEHDTGGWPLTPDELAWLRLCWREALA